MITGHRVIDPQASMRRSILLNILYYCLAVSVAGLVFSIAVSSVAFGIALIVWVTLLIVYPAAVTVRTPLDIIFCLYIFCDLLSSLFSIDIAGSFLGAKRLALFAIVYFTIITVNTPQRLLRMVLLFIGAVSVASTVEVVLGALRATLMDRLSIYQHYMTEGGIKMFAILLPMPLLLEGRTPRRLRYLVGILLLPVVLTLILTQTRSSWLGLLGGVAVLGLARNRKPFLAFAIVLILFLFVLAPHTLQQRALSIFDPHNPNNVSRIHMIGTGLRMFIDHPVLGVGDVNLRALYVQYTIPIDAAEGGHLHNNIVQMLVTLGTMGFVVVMALFALIGRSLWLAYRNTNGDWLLGSICLGGFSAYIGFQVNGLFEYNFGDHEIAVLLWFVVGLAYSAQRLLSPAGTSHEA
jgi:putative inorganic carbon (HCO3(-)) transporter